MKKHVHVYVLQHFAMDPLPASLMLFSARALFIVDVFHLPLKAVGCLFHSLAVRLLKPVEVVVLEEATLTSWRHVLYVALPPGAFGSEASPLRYCVARVASLVLHFKERVTGGFVLRGDRVFNGAMVFVGCFDVESRRFPFFECFALSLP